MKQNKLSSLLQLAGWTSIALSGTCAYLLSIYPLVWKILLALGASGLISALWLKRVELQHTLSKRSTRYGLNSILMSLVVFAIVVVINLIALNHDIKTDITKNRVHTLSDQTIKVLKGLEREVTLRVFLAPTQMSEFTPALERYLYQTNKLKKEYVDLDRDPMAARKYEVRQAGTILVETDTRTSRVDGVSSPQDPKFEEKLTNAIIQAIKGDKKKIYFLTGHGEHLIADATGEGYSGMRDALASSLFNVEELLLLEKGKVPEDAEILILAGPRKDFFPQELALLDEYLKKGGKLFMMLEPESSKVLKPFLEKHGVVWSEGKVVQENNPAQALVGGNTLAPVVTSYDRSHEITREARQMSLFLMATPIEKSEKPPEGVSVSKLLSTSSRSREGTISGKQLAFGPKDRQGPLTLALAITGKATAAVAPKEESKDTKAPEAEAPKAPEEYRMVVVGDSDFGTNALRGQGMNSDLFQNMISWLAKEEGLISIRPKSTEEGSFDITEQRMKVIFYASVFFLPFSMFLSGLAVWLVRRKK
jgi:ABC-type uncharacterized transport system involved in gliding motility auxiliary subunit